MAPKPHLDDRRLKTKAPRWVRVLGLFGVILALLFIALHLSGHGLGGHTH